jgi:hypothetical protein
MPRAFLSHLLVSIHSPGTAVVPAQELVLLSVSVLGQV